MKKYNSIECIPLKSLLYYEATISAPQIVSTTRTNTITASVTFIVPPSEQNADYFELNYFTMTGPTNAFTDIQVSCYSCIEMNGNT